jgi:hypothetical protein
MCVIKIKRTFRSESRRGRSLRQFAHDFFATENHIEFVIEALLFGALLAISMWPIAAAASAIGQLL